MSQKASPRSDNSPAQISGSASISIPVAQRSHSLSLHIQSEPPTTSTCSPRDISSTKISPLSASRLRIKIPDSISGWNGLSLVGCCYALKNHITQDDDYFPSSLPSRTGGSDGFESSRTGRLACEGHSHVSSLTVTPSSKRSKLDRPVDSSNMHPSVSSAAFELNRISRVQSPVVMENTDNVGMVVEAMQDASEMTARERFVYFKRRLHY